MCHESGNIDKSFSYACMHTYMATGLPHTLCMYIYQHVQTYIRTYVIRYMPVFICHSRAVERFRARTVLAAPGICTNTCIHAWPKMNLCERQACGSLGAHVHVLIKLVCCVCKGLLRPWCACPCLSWSTYVAWFSCFHSYGYTSKIFFQKRVSWSMIYVCMYVSMCV